MPREKVAAGLRCLILITVFVMTRTQSAPRTPLFDVVISFGAAYVLVSTFFPWGRYDMRRAVLAMLSLDILMITALIYSQSGVYSEYYLLYYLPILHASVRLDFRDAVGTCLLSAASYFLIGLLQGSGMTITTTVISRVLTFTVSASLMAGFFVLLSREQHAYRRLNQYYHDAMQAKSDFLSRVSHEFRTPLTAIVGFSQLLYENEDSLDVGRRHEYLVIVREQSQHLARMIEDMLALSRVDEGRLVLKSEPTHLPDVVESALMLLDRPGDRERVEVSLEPRTRAVWVDRNKIEHVLARLLHSALSLSGESAQVSVRIGPAVDEELVQVTIQASEWEASEEDLEPLLSHDGSAAMRARRSGKHLGLSAARALVELHDGRIWVEDSAGAGAAVCFTLPAYRTQETGPEVIVGMGTDGSAAGAETNGEGHGCGRRPVRTEAHAGQPGSLG